MAGTVFPRPDAPITQPGIRTKEGATRPTARPTRPRQLPWAGGPDGHGPSIMRQTTLPPSRQVDQAQLS
jgi:hypothetical protein